MKINLENIISALRDSFKSRFEKKKNAMIECLEKKKNIVSVFFDQKIFSAK